MTGDSGQSTSDRLFTIFLKRKSPADQTAEAAATVRGTSLWQRAWTRAVGARPTSAPGTAGDSVCDVDQLGHATKWAAGGFTALTGVLVFFGIKDGVLDQALRLNPRAALCVFLLLGAGTLAAVFAPAINKAWDMRWWAVIVALGLMLIITAIYLPDLQIDLDEIVDDETGWWGILPPGAVRIIRYVTGGPQALLVVLLIVGFLYALVFALVKKATLPALAGVVIIGVAATSLGLYGASKLSVESKMVLAEPQVSAVREQQGGQSTLKITATASHMRDRQLRLTVWGQPRVGYVDPRALHGPHWMVWRGLLEPTNLDNINSTITIPLVPPRWEKLVVGHCTMIPEHKKRRLGEARCGENDDIQVLESASTIGGPEMTGHIVATSATSLRVTLTGKDVPPGHRIEAEICRVRKGLHATQLAMATLTPDANGSLTWSLDVPAGKNGDALVLQYHLCGGRCPLGWRQVARYTLP